VEKVDDLFLVAALKTQTETIKLTARTLQFFSAHQKCAIKFDFLPCLGVHLQLSPINYAIFFSKFFSPPWGCLGHVHRATPSVHCCHLTQS